MHLQQGVSESLSICLVCKGHKGPRGLETWVGDLGEQILSCRPTSCTSHANVLGVGRAANPTGKQEEEKQLMAPGKWWKYLEKLQGAEVGPGAAQAGGL